MVNRLRILIHDWLQVLDVRGSCDNSQIVSCSMDKTVMLWDVTSGNWTRKWRGHQVEWETKVYEVFTITKRATTRAWLKALTGTSTN